MVQVKYKSACKHCTSQHVKCDGRKPECGKCRKIPGHQCVYEPMLPRGGNCAERVKRKRELLNHLANVKTEDLPTYHDHSAYESLELPEIEQEVKRQKRQFKVQLEDYSQPTYVPFFPDEQDDSSDSEDEAAVSLIRLSNAPTEPTSTYPTPFTLTPFLLSPFGAPPLVTEDLSCTRTPLSHTPKFEWSLDEFPFPSLMVPSRASTPFRTPTPFN
jgi:hypothetical protein